MVKLCSCSTGWTRIILFVTCVIISSVVLMLVSGATVDEYRYGTGPTTTVISSSSSTPSTRPPHFRRRTTPANTHTTTTTNTKKQKKKNDVQCGDVLETDVTLLDDLNCYCERGRGSTFAALTVVGPATLDLNGFSVMCEHDKWDNTETDRSAIIQVVGRAGVITNGNISRGNFGIVLAGQGHHTVTQVKVHSTANDGLQINAPFCEVTACDFRKNGKGPNSDESGDGIDIGELSQYSVVRGNTITQYGDDGVSCRGDYNIIRGNTIDGEAPQNNNKGRPRSEDGITIQGRGNQIIGNTIRKTQSDGIEIKVQGFNILRSNTIIGTVEGKGMKIGSSNNVVVFNTVTATTQNTGFLIERGGNQNYVADNRSHQNAQTGFTMQETNNNVLVRNTATENHAAGFVVVVGKVKGTLGGLAHIVAGNTATNNNNNASGGGRVVDFQELGNQSRGDCTQNAYLGNRATTTAAADPSCLLLGGDTVDLSLQDDVATASPSTAPTHAPTERREKCENQPQYLFENTAKKNCEEWALKKKNCNKQDTTTDAAKGRRVSFFCPLQCNPDCFTPVPSTLPSSSPTEVREACDNKEQYLFKNKAKKNCETWVANKPTQHCTKRDTTEAGQGRLVSFFCPLQCTMGCVTTPVPSAMPSSAPTARREDCTNKKNYVFQNTPGRTCEKWVANKPTKYCNRKETTDVPGQQERRVSFFCPQQCNPDCFTPVPSSMPSSSPTERREACDNKEKYLFKNIAGRNCETWVAKKPTQYCTKRDTTKQGQGRRVAFFCPRQCNIGCVTAAPSVVPSSSPSTTPSVPPSSSPSLHPRDAPSISPSAVPSSRPSVSSAPSVDPREAPSVAPSAVPSSRPSSNPSSGRPSTAPSSSHSPSTSSPSSSHSPSEVPSSSPSGRPSSSSNNPSSVPRLTPSVSPSTTVPSSSSSHSPSTEYPSSSPSMDPSSEPPSVAPRAVPSSRPSSKTSSRPSTAPSTRPSGGPSQSPSENPSSSSSRRPSSFPPSARPSFSSNNSPSVHPSSTPSVDPSESPSV